ncbi:MAG: hypothetical protein O3B47_04395, partial [bacterium]|nr:hypothetical protein [bacterium]
FFATLLAIPFLIAHYFIVKNQSGALKTLLWIIIISKLLVALTMGAFETTWFTSFIQNFIANPTENPWVYSYQSHYTEFGYPPFLMYIHAFFMWIFKPLLNLEPPYWATPYAYSLFKIPLLIIDLFFLSYFLKARKGAVKKTAFLFYLLNPFFLSYIYFSNHMDWVVVFPFFLSILEFEKNKLSKKFLVLFGISLMLKPLGLLYIPIVLVELLPKIKEKPYKIFKYIGLMLIPILTWKLSELPYSLSMEYRELFGVDGFERTFGNSNFLPVPLFTIAFVLLGIYWSINVFLKNNWSISERIIVLTLVLAGLGHPSPAWILWGLPFIVLLMMKNKIKYTPLWWVWTMFFVFRHMLVPQSPFFSSFGVFITYFLKLDYGYTLGIPLNFLNKNLGANYTNYIVFLAGILWRISSLTLAALIIKDKLQNSLKSFKNPISLTTIVIFALLISGCSPKYSCDNKYNYTLKMATSNHGFEEYYELECCVHNPYSSNPACIPENRDIIVPLPFPASLSQTESKYTMIDSEEKDPPIYESYSSF